MSVDLAAAADFMATHARVLDRRRFGLLNGEADPSGALAALDGYRNPDGGYGWGLEPDVRSPESQPGPAHHAFEVFAEIGPATAPQAVALCDWLDSITLPDGGHPMALPLGMAAGSAPWWQGADPSVSSLQTTALAAATAQRVAAHDSGVAAHPWLERATRYCLDAIADADEAPSGYVLVFSLRLLDAVYESRPEAAELMRRLGGHVPEDGVIRVTGGAEDEALHPLDVAPEPGRPVRDLFTQDVIAADLDRVAGVRTSVGLAMSARVPSSPSRSSPMRATASAPRMRVVLFHVSSSARSPHVDPAACTRYPQ